MIYFEDINKQLLNTLNSSTLAGMSDYEVDETLALLMFRAIADFRFPQMALTYQQELNPNLGTKKYYFTNNITQKEINVLLALMKKYWLEQQLDSERNFEMLYYDKDVRTFSRGNIMQQIRTRYEDAKIAAEQAQFDYGRVDTVLGTAAVGTVNDAE
jgi:hypothetical protein